MDSSVIDRHWSDVLLTSDTDENGKYSEEVQCLFVDSREAKNCQHNFLIKYNVLKNGLI